ncbi:MAG: TonB-dependent receptor [Bacteroidetes bacterium]|nr:TonB-dependent receptor [Bacteroidota bacterium]
MFKILTLSLLLANLATSAQTEIIGTILQKETKKPLEFASVRLLNSDSIIHESTLTDSNGAFKITAKPGETILQITYIGQVLYTQKIELNEKQINVGILEMVTTKEISNTVVTAKRKIIQRKVDRLVFNVENSSKASAGDALDVLSVTPGVQVQNNKISIIGKNSLQVLINDKAVLLSDEELSNFLKSMASENIKNIEVITTPPAKYEAAGNSGLINITLKQVKKNSWNAQLKSSFKKQTYSTGSLGGSFNSNKEKLSIASLLNYSAGCYYQEQDDYAYFPDGLWYTSSPFRVNAKRMNARIDVSYQITPKWTMGAQYLYNKNRRDITDAPYTAVFDYRSNDVMRFLQSTGSMNLIPKIHSVNYHNEVALDTAGRKIELNVDYFNYHNPDTKKYNGFSKIQHPMKEQFYRGLNQNIQNVANVSVKLDVEVPTKWMDVSFGGKVSKSKSTNTINYFNSGFVNTPVTLYSLSQNDFEYKEAIQALYVSVVKKFNEKWDSQLGVRMEATETDSKSTNLNLATKNNYLKLFPSFYVTYNASNNYSFSFNYSKRIERPDFFDLNPNIYFINPFQTIEGNAFLQPSFVDNFELSNTFHSFETKVYYSYEDNLFSQVPLADPNTNIIRFTNENFINTNRVGISENYSFNKISYWSSNNSFDINYSKSKFNLAQKQEDQKGLNATISTDNDFSLNKEKTILLGLNYWYRFPGVSGIFSSKSASSLSLSLQCFVFHKNVNITLRGNDILKTSAERSTTTVNGIFQKAIYYFDARSLQLSLSYNFGNKNISGKKHITGNEDEKGRTGN